MKQYVHFTADQIIGTSFLEYARLEISVCFNIINRYAKCLPAEFLFSDLRTVIQKEHKESEMQLKAEYKHLKKNQNEQIDLSALISHFQATTYVNRLKYKVQAETDLRTIKNSVLEVVIEQNC